MSKLLKYVPANIFRSVLCAMISCFFVCKIPSAYAQQWTGNQFSGMGSCHAEMQATVPMTPDGRGHMLVPVVVNGHQTQFILDTGASHTTILPEMVGPLNLTATHVAPRNMGVVGGAFLADSILVDSLVFGGDEYKQKWIYEMALGSQQSAQAMPGSTPAGLLGADILSNYAIDYDGRNNTLTLYHVANCQSITPPWREPYQKQVITFNTAGKYFVLPVKMNGYSLTAIFDTGCGSFAALATSSLLRAGLTQDMLNNPGTAVSGVGGASKEMAVARINSFIVGPAEYHQVPVHLVDQVGNADMLIGQGYMQGKHFWLSYSTMEFFVQN